MNPRKLGWSVFFCSSTACACSAQSFRNKNKEMIYNITECSSTCRSQSFALFHEHYWRSISKTNKPPPGPTSKPLFRLLRWLPSPSPFVFSSGAWAANWSTYNVYKEPKCLVIGPSCSKDGQCYPLENLYLVDRAVCFVNNGNRTECSLIQSVIIPVNNKLKQLPSGSPIC